ncbi:hypothetical protein [Thermoactinospora rubra]|uniref:hypothetical protein n=1 Tax=Thermoactinospora rubra TaxID=1088767 RepID=UPI000A11B7C7|nr:hypothetical protein [Thermoactinospora rubra]
MPAPDVAALLLQLDADLADDARTAAEWLTGDEPLESVTQLDVCEFLWCTLPLKVDGDPVRLARALGALLRLGGLDRYAALCESATTRRILRVYAQHGEEAGTAAYQEALAAAGVLPPDVPELSWSMIMGPEERGAQAACAAALELAMLSGQPVDRVALTRSWLTLPRAELGGDSWLHRVHGERLNRWVLGRGEARRELAQPFELRLHAPVPPQPLPGSGPVEQRWEAVTRSLLVTDADEAALLLLADGASYALADLRARVEEVAGNSESLAALLDRLAAFGLRSTDPVRLTPTGRLAALAALRAHALRPRVYVNPR